MPHKCEAKGRRYIQEEYVVLYVILDDTWSHRKWLNETDNNDEQQKNASFLHHHHNALVQSCNKTEWHWFFF